MKLENKMYCAKKIQYQCRVVLDSATSLVITKVLNF